MRFVTPKINEEISYKKVSALNLVAEPKTVKKDMAGNPVTSRRFALVEDGVDHNGKPRFSPLGYFDKFENRELVKDQLMDGDPHYFQIMEDGKEQEVMPFKRTQNLKVLMEVSATALNDYLIESVYELYNNKSPETISALYVEAERYIKDDLMGVAQFSWGNGFVQYYALIYPVVKDNTFVWVMVLTKTKIIFQQMMDIPVALKTKEALPTVVALPPIEEFVK